MITGELRGQIDRIWDSFWTGGISNPLEVIEQIAYLLFIRRGRGEWAIPHAPAYHSFDGGDNAARPAPPCRCALRRRNATAVLDEVRQRAVA